MDRNSEVLFSLKPVTFRYKKEIHPIGTSQFGLVADGDSNGNCYTHCKSAPRNTSRAPASQCSPAPSLAAKSTYSLGHCKALYKSLPPPRRRSFSASATNVEH